MNVDRFLWVVFAALVVGALFGAYRAPVKVCYTEQRSDNRVWLAQIDCDRLVPGYVVIR